jgi:sulfur carrier protein ThiS
MAKRQLKTVAVRVEGNILHPQHHTDQGSDSGEEKQT